MSVTRKCVCCSKQYEFCPTCAKKDQPAWMVTFCSVTCKEFFNLVSAYNSKRIDQQTVWGYIQSHGINLDNCSDPIKKILRGTEAETQRALEKQNEKPQGADAEKVEETSERTPKLLEHHTRSRSRRRRHR